MESKVKLSVLGFSFNQTKSSTYGLVLAEDDGIRRLMVIIGTPEAQSIAFVLHNTEPPRPLTHDLCVSVISEFGLILKEVLIYKYENGIFYSRLFMSDCQGNKNVTIESRTSDAIAIALRSNSPVYTTETIMREFSIVISDENTCLDNDSGEIVTDPIKEVDYSGYNQFQLESMMSDAIKAEDYELASLLRDELKKIKNEESGKD